MALLLVLNNFFASDLIFAAAFLFSRIGNSRPGRRLACPQEETKAKRQKGRKQDQFKNAASPICYRRNE